MAQSGNVRTEEGLPRKESDKPNTIICMIVAAKRISTCTDDGSVLFLIVTAKRCPADALDWPSGNYKLTSHEIQESLVTSE